MKLTLYFNLYEELGTERFNKAIGEGIRKVRKSLGWTQTKLAEKLKLSENTVKNYEAGQRKSPIPLITITNFIDTAEKNGENLTLEEFFKICKLNS